MEGNTVGDLIDDGQRIIVEDNADYTVIMTRVGDKIEVKTITKNLQATFDHNAAEAAEFNRTGRHSNLVKVAGIPADVYFQWLKEGVVEDQKALRRRLNDSDFRKFRTNDWSL